MRKVLGIIFFVIAGLFIVTAMMISFYNKPVSQHDAKIWVLGVMAIFAIIPLLVGLAIIKFKNCQKIIGIILMSSAGVVAFMAFSFICYSADEEFMRMMPPNSFELMSDYFSGGVTTLLSGITGFILFNKAK